MRRAAGAFLAVLTVCVMTGCGMSYCGMLNKEQRDAVHALVLAKLDEAWAEKGAEAVAAKVDELVAAGKITAAQGEALKAAAQQGYTAMRAKAEKIMAGELDNTAK